MSEKLNTSPGNAVDLVDQLSKLANRNKAFKDEESDFISFTIEEGEKAEAWDINNDYGGDEEFDDDSQSGGLSDKVPVRDMFPAMPLIKEKFRFSADRVRSVTAHSVIDFEFSYTISVQDIRLPVHMAEAHLESLGVDPVLNGEAAVREVGPSILERSVCVEASTCSQALTVRETVEFTDQEGDPIDSLSTVKLGTTDEVGYQVQSDAEQVGQTGLKQYPHYIFSAKRDNDVIENLSVEELIVLQRESDDIFDRAAIDEDTRDFQLAQGVLKSMIRAINRQFLGMA